MPFTAKPAFGKLPIAARKSSENNGPCRKWTRPAKKLIQPKTISNLNAREYAEKITTILGEQWTVESMPTRFTHMQHPRMQMTQALAFLGSLITSFAKSNRRHN